jgi:hypothetical protein
MKNLSVFSSLDLPTVREQSSALSRERVIELREMIKQAQTDFIEAIQRLDVEGEKLTWRNAVEEQRYHEIRCAWLCQLDQLDGVERQLN